MEKFEIIFKAANLSVRNEIHLQTELIENIRGFVTVTEPISRIYERLKTKTKETVFQDLLSTLSQYCCVPKDISESLQIKIFCYALAINLSTHVLNATGVVWMISEQLKLTLELPYCRPDISSDQSEGEIEDLLEDELKPIKKIKRGGKKKTRSTSRK